MNDLKDIPKKACDRRVSTKCPFLFCSLLLFCNSFCISKNLEPNVQMHHVLQINEFVKRARAAKIHAYIISHLKKEMPSMMGKAKVQQRLIDNLADEFLKVALLPSSLPPCESSVMICSVTNSSKQVQREFHLPAGDFPNVDQFKEILSGYNIDRFERLKPKMIQSVDDMLGYDIPDLLKSFRNPYD